MAQYYFTKKFFAGEIARIKQIFRRGVEEGWGANRIQQELMREGLGYRRQEILYDYRLYRWTRSARSTEGQLRAMDAFDVFEELRKKHKLTYDKAIELWKLRQTPERVTLTTKPIVEEINKRLEQTFPDLYH